MSELSIVGKSVPHIDGKEKVTGTAQFVTDLKLPRMLYGKILRSPYPHAKILHVDTSKAERLMGVKSILTAKDTPQKKFGPRSEDWNILAPDKVRFIGDEVAAVAAMDEDIAEEALQLIDVEYEQLPAVFDPVEAMKPGAPLVQEDKERNIAATFKLSKGDIQKAFEESYYIYEDTYSTSQAYQAYLEPMACVAQFDLSGKLTLWAATQVPNLLRLSYSKALGISQENIRVILPYYGGGFGAKMETNLHMIAALLSKKSERPVRMVNTREEDFMAGNPRVPMVIDIKLGVKKDGTLTGKKVRIIGGAGSRLVYAHIIVSTACYRCDSTYKFQNLETEGYTVYTNTVPTGCFRGFGNAQMHFVLESALDMISKEIGIDPVALRLVNAFESGEESVHGWKMKSCGLKECVIKGARLADWEKKRAEKKRGRGVGLACCNHVSGNKAFFKEWDGGAGIVRISADGKVCIFCGESEMGQGQKTVFAQIVAEELGVTLDRIEVAPVDTDISPFGVGSFATRGTLMGGNGARAAAMDAKRQLFEIASQMLECNPQDLESRSNQIYVKGSPEQAVSFFDVTRKSMALRAGAPIVGTGFYLAPTEFPDPETRYGNVSPAYPFGCHIAQVEVDEETGQVKLVDYVAAHDVGKAINPMAVEGQIHGGVGMGSGWALLENMATENGKILNPNFVDYIIPSSNDLPNIKTILVEPIDPEGPFGAKGIGEPALNPAAPAVANAIYDAVGVRIKDLPISREKILKALKEKNKKEGR